MNTTRQYECPICGDEISISFSSQNVGKDPPTCCPSCHTHLVFDCDAEFINDMWQDRSRLVEMPKQ